MKDVFKSDLGIQMSESTVNVFRYMKENYGEFVIAYAINLSEEGDFELSLGGDHYPQDMAIKDEVCGIDFYWYCEPSYLEAVKKYIVDKSLDGGSKLIPLSTEL